jgi:hypothetical protein
MPTFDEPTVLDIRAINTQLLIDGLPEQALADQLQRQLAFTSAITNSLNGHLLSRKRDRLYLLFRHRDTGAIRSAG